MPAPISDDLRQRIVALYGKSGATYDLVAEDLGVGRATVSRVLRLHRETGSVSPKPASGGRPKSLRSDDVQELTGMVDETPDARLTDLAEAWSQAHPARAVSRQTIGRALAEADYTRKKRVSRHKSENDQTSH